MVVAAEQGDQGQQDRRGDRETGLVVEMSFHDNRGASPPAPSRPDVLVVGHLLSATLRHRPLAIQTSRGGAGGVERGCPWGPVQAVCFTPRGRAELRR